MTDIFDRSLDDVEIEISDNKLVKGEDINITAIDPTMFNVLVGIGWQLNAFDSDTLDVDVSCFLLNKDGKTRVDEDFIFYNNLSACEGAIVHNGDNLIGAGDGDDESISVDMNGIPFDVVKVMFVLSIYKGEEKNQQMSSIRNGYIRILNIANGFEVLRYEISPDVANSEGETSMLVASLNREGPKWHFEAIGQLVQGGLAKVAMDRDIIVHEG